MVSTSPLGLLAAHTLFAFYLRTFFVVGHFIGKIALVSVVDPIKYLLADEI